MSHRSCLTEPLHALFLKQCNNIWQTPPSPAKCQCQRGESAASLLHHPSDRQGYQRGLNNYTQNKSEFQHHLCLKCKREFAMVSRFGWIYSMGFGELAPIFQCSPGQLQTHHGRMDEILNCRKVDLMFKKKNPFSCELTPNTVISNKQKQNRDIDTWWLDSHTTCCNLIFSRIC